MTPKTINKKVIVTIVMLVIVSMIVQLLDDWQSPLGLQCNQTPLHQVLADLPGWSISQSIPLTDDIVQGLKLDDYIYRSFGPEGNKVSLYIGFYRTAGKVGAAHDPLVCFQGQGWEIVKQGKGCHPIIIKDQIHQINYATIIARRGNRNEMIIYWFQTHDKTSDNTFGQKIDMIWQRIMGENENNAFVRISAPLPDDDSQQPLEQKMLNFVEAFYPRFFSYM